MEFGDDTPHGGNCRLEVFEFDNIFDSIANKMDNVG